MALRVACVVGVMGSPLTGKGVFAHEWMVAGKAPLRLVWSPVEKSDNYAGLLDGKLVATIPALVDAIKAGARAVVLVPSLDRAEMLRQFDFFCRVVWACPRARVLVEELSRVTMPSWAPPAWKNLSTSGSHQGLELMATAQRPAQVDKDFLSGCTELRCYRQNEQPDAQSVSRALGPVEATGALVPWQQIMTMPDLHYWHLWRSPRRLETGLQPLPGQRQRKKKSA